MQFNGLDRISPRRWSYWGLTARGYLDMFKSSIQCERNYRLSLSEYRYEKHNCLGWLANQYTDRCNRQTVRSNEQMVQSMKGATKLLGSMNRQMNLPALQRIASEFERENEIMDQRQDMMDEAIDEAMGLEDEEEGEEVVKEVLDEIGVDLGQSVGSPVPQWNAPSWQFRYGLGFTNHWAIAWRSSFRFTEKCC